MMKNQLIIDFGFDTLVADYALIMVEHRSVQEAVNFIFGEDDGSV